MLGFPSPSFPVTEAMTTYFKNSMWSSLMIERIYSLLYQFEHRRSIFIDVFQKHNVHLSSETQSTIIYYTRTSRSTLIIRYLYSWWIREPRAESAYDARILIVARCWYTYVLVLTVFWYNWYRCRCLSTICASTMILFAPTISRIRHVSKTSVVFCYNCWLLLTVINFICYQAQASRKHHHVLLTIKFENLSTHDESTTWKAANCPPSRCRFHRQSLQGRGRVCGSIESFLEKYR